jgi:hypothetical protein
MAVADLHVSMLNAVLAKCAADVLGPEDLSALLKELNESADEAKRLNEVADETKRLNEAAAAGKGPAHMPHFATAHELDRYRIWLEKGGETHTPARLAKFMAIAKAEGDPVRLATHAPPPIPAAPVVRPADPAVAAEAASAAAGKPITAAPSPTPPAVPAKPSPLATVAPPPSARFTVDDSKLKRVPPRPDPRARLSAGLDALIPKGHTPSASVATKGVLESIAEDALKRKLAPDVLVSDELNDALRRSHRASVEAASGVGRRTGAPQPVVRTPEIPQVAKPLGRATPVLPRSRWSTLAKVLTGVGLGTAGTVAAPPVLKGLSTPATPAATTSINPWVIAGGLAGLTGLGVGGYLLKQHFKKKRDAVAKLDEDNEVI